MQDSLCCNYSSLPLSLESSHRTNGHDCVPIIKLYLQKQMVGWIWPSDCSLLIPVLYSLLLEGRDALFITASSGLSNTVVRHSFDINKCLKNKYTSKWKHTEYILIWLIFYFIKTIQSIDLSGGSTSIHFISVLYTVLYTMKIFFCMFVCIYIYMLNIFIYTWL